MKDTEIHERKNPAAGAKFAFRRILVPTDFTAGSDYAFACGLDLARRYRGHVHLMHVMGPVEGDAYSLLKYSPEASATNESPDEIIYGLLKSTVEEHDTEGVFVDPVKQRGGSVAPTLLRYAKNEAIDLIVIGVEGRAGFGRYFSEKIVEEIVRESPCPVLTVKVPKSLP